jgi:hypothetical protein
MWIAPSCAKGNLRPFVEGFIGTKLHDDEVYNFNLEEVLGEACLLNVVHTEKDGNTYSNIQGASPLPKGMVAPEPFNQKRSLDINLFILGIPGCGNCVERQMLAIRTLKSVGPIDFFGGRVSGVDHPHGYGALCRLNGRNTRLTSDHNVGEWHLMSFHGDAAIQSLSERSGHSASRALPNLDF